MTILNRYILKEALLYFCVSIFVFTGILLTLRMLKFTDLIINRGVESRQIAMVFISIVPTFLEIAIPLAALLGVMLAFARLSGDSEIIVMRASGVSITQLTKAVLIFGALTTLISLVVSLELRPWGFKKLSETLFEITRQSTTAGLTEGVFNKLGQLTLYSEKIQSETGSLSDILIDDRRDKNIRKVIVAKSGLIVSNADEQTISIYLHDGTIHEIVAGKYILTRFDSNSLLLNPDELQGGDSKERGIGARELYLPQLRERLAYYHQLLDATEAESLTVSTTTPVVQSPTTTAPPYSIKDLKKTITKFEIEGARRFSMPFASLVLALIALPLGIQPPRTQRTWGIGLSAALGLAVFIGYYGILSVNVALIERGSIAVVAGLWLPNILAAIIALYMLRKVGTEQWQSIGHAYEKIVSYLTMKRTPTQIC